MTYRYCAIGDSLTTGFGTLAGGGFVPLYRRAAESRLHTGVAAVNLGINGLDSAELADKVSRDPLFRRSLRGAQLITVSIGGNDLIRAARRRATAREMERTLEACKRNCSSVLNDLYRLKAQTGEPYIIRMVGLYNPYPQWEEAAVWVRRYNRYAAGLSNGIYSFADIYDPFARYGRRLLSLDGVHPNREGYRVIADRLNALGYGVLGWGARRG